jgi:hypothetical protein
MGRSAASSKLWVKNKKKDRWEKRGRVYEWVYDPKRKHLTHQLFKPGRKIDGKVN